MLGGEAKNIGETRRMVLNKTKIKFTLSNELKKWSVSSLGESFCWYKLPVQPRLRQSKKDR